MEHVLISSARHLGVPTKFGIKKILRNILALQQSVKAVSDDQHGDFQRAKAYYSMFFQTPQVSLSVGTIFAI